ncbi:hypothetical protein L838_4393 [Mycobacterium avium MAV_120709_2344]|nr:hypothetical protein L838_4393 [Mycobacterium avium MAV_120709_2344]
MDSPACDSAAGYYAQPGITYRLLKLPHSTVAVAWQPKLRR